MDTSSGESRRNENVQITLIDNNVLKELNRRMGITATVVKEFEVERGYFGAEFGGPPTSSLHLDDSKVSRVRGTLYESHNNSIFSARSFFQVGDVRPARTNDYGFQFGVPLWSGADIFFDGSQQRIRGNVNGNVLVLAPDERVPLARDPETRAFVQRIIDAFPRSFPTAPTSMLERSTPTHRRRSTTMRSERASIKPGRTRAGFRSDTTSRPKK